VSYFFSRCSRVVSLIARVAVLLRGGCMEAVGKNSWWQQADHRCCWWVMSEVGMQHSIMRCGALHCRHRWVVSQRLYCTRWGKSSQCSSACYLEEECALWRLLAVSDWVSSFLMTLCAISFAVNWYGCYLLVICVIHAHCHVLRQLSLSKSCSVTPSCCTPCWKPLTKFRVKCCELVAFARERTFIVMRWNCDELFVWILLWMRINNMDVCCSWHRVG